MTNRLLSHLHRAGRRIFPPDTYSMLLLATVAGFFGMLATKAFRDGIEGLQWLLVGQSGSLVAMSTHLPWYLRIVLPTVGGLVAGMLLLLAKRMANDTSADYMETVAFGDGRIPVRQTLLRSLSSLVTIATGGSIGREGSMIQLAAACASVMGRWLHLTPERLRLLVACGAAAGITSAYNAPIAGAFFVAEIVLGSIVMDTFGPLLLASVVANLTMRGFANYLPTYEMPFFPSLGGADMPAFAALGIIAGLATPLFLKLLDFSKATFRKTGWPLPVRLGVGGLAVGIISVFVPQVWGNGYSVVNSILHNPWVWTSVLAILVFKVLATALTAGSGAIGGVFTPTLFVGAASGYLFGFAIDAVWPHAAAPYAFALAGMGAYLAAATKAPLMVILMMFDMTWSANVLLPVALACIVAYFVALPASDLSLYEITARRYRDLKVRDRLRKLQVGDLIQPTHTVLPLSAGFAEIAAMFRENAVKYVYIVDAEGRFCGVVAAQDITQALLDPNASTARDAEDLLHRDFLMLTHDMTLAEALHVFLEHQGERLPAILSKTDPVFLGAVNKSALLDAYYRLHQPLI